MTLHKHWNAPAEAETPRTVEEPKPIVAAPMPTLTHVYIGQRYYDGDTTTKVFATREACVAWKEGLSGDYDDFDIFHREIRY